MPDSRVFGSRNIAKSPDVIRTSIRESHSINRVHDSAACGLCLVHTITWVRPLWGRGGLDSEPKTHSIVGGARRRGAMGNVSTFTDAIDCLWNSGHRFRGDSIAARAQSGCALSA